MLSSGIVPAGNSETADNSANVLPHRWQKGTSGNPSGRRSSAEIRRLLKNHTPRAAMRIVELVESEDERVALMAAKEVLDRYYGKVGPEGEDDEAGADRKHVTINIVRYGDNDQPAEPVATPTVSVRTLALP